MKVRNMKSTTSDRAIPNQFIIVDDEGDIYFQSYNTIIAKKEGGRVVLDRQAWDYSVTTGKYRNMFLGETKKETERKIREGVYELMDLNK